MINQIKKIVPKGLKLFYREQKLNIQVIKDFIYDYKRFKKYSCSLRFKNKDQYKAFLIKEYHAIEKGLALRYPRKGFGVVRISYLVDVLNEYLSTYGKDEVTDVTIATLFEYREFEKANIGSNPILSKIEKLLASYQMDSNDLHLGGTKIVTKEDVLRSVKFDFDSFFKSRFSTRDFTEDPVDDKLVEDAIATALYTPSVCNRQAWKVYQIAASNKQLRDKFLKVQNGNKGFGEYIGSLLVVTGKLSSFFSYERNQVFVDGGMFAMSIVMALHAKGLGTCCLNTSYTAERNEEFHQVMDMDADCVPIMFIAVGHLKDEYKVAVSQRKSLSEVVEKY